MSNHTDVEFRVRASRAGYIVFGAIYSPMFLAYIYGFLNGRAGNAASAILIPLALLLGTYAWLLGFKIRITPDQFEYRDGLWRWHTCPLDEVRDVKHTWVEFKNLGRTLKIPRMVVRRYDLPEKPILVNAKPFPREAIIRMKELLETGGTTRANQQR
jgi:hypothetical protein